MVDRNRHHFDPGDVDRLINRQLVQLDQAQLLGGKAFEIGPETVVEHFAANISITSAGAWMGAGATPDCNRLTAYKGIEPTWPA
ncbi:MAG: hypothetical protein Ct9H300mP1_06670 [Planctomycetaceae bacterium]|nr:MAG: hypothetical protein Ct9H300mP1_06670 [Planctomycetaceae bacterium]